LAAVAMEHLAARTKAKSNPPIPLEKKDEVVANVIWHFLELSNSTSMSHNSPQVHLIIILLQLMMKTCHLQQSELGCIGLMLIGPPSCM